MAQQPEHRAMSERLQPHQIRVFLSSPGDVADERALARRLLKEELPSDPLLQRGSVTFDVVSWDDPAAPIPMDAAITPQEAVNRFGPKPSECDVVVVVLWSRLGTHLDLEAFCKPDRKPYLSGTEWEFEDALNAPEPQRPTVFVYRRTEEPKLGMRDPDWAEKRRQFDLVEEFLERFRNLDGSFRGGFTPYGTPTDFKERLENDIKHLLREHLFNRSQGRGNATPAVAIMPTWTGSPYPGLRPFTVEEAAVFFGRGREVDALIARLRDPTQRFVAVVGASGTGKSSLVRAGLLSRLADDAVEGSRHWRVLAFTPGAAGDDPFLALASELKSMLPPAWRKPQIAIAKGLAEAPQRLLDHVDVLMAKQPSDAALVLFVDQLEELFTLPAESRRRFVELLGQAVDNPRLRVMATLRADFLPQCAAEQALAALLQAGTFVLGAPRPTALSDMIRRPAERAGLDLGEGLVDEILTDAGGEPGEALPLVAFCLEELYRRTAPEHRLTLDAYRAMGGLRGAIARRADELLKELQAAEAAGLSAALPQTFRALVHVDATGKAARQRTPRNALLARPAPIPQLAETLIHGRLLLAEEAGGRATITLAHEALLQWWPALREWVDQNRAQMQRIQRQMLGLAAHESKDRQHAAEALKEIGPAAAEAAPEVVPALVATLGDDDVAVRRAAIEALTAIGPAAVLPLANALEAADKVLRRAAAEALGRIEPAAVEMAPEVVPTLVAALADADVAVRRTAAELLGRIGATAGSALAAALGGSSTTVRRTAAEVLGRIGPAAAEAAPEVVPALVAALGDADATVRRAVAEALKQTRFRLRNSQGGNDPPASLGSSAMPHQIRDRSLMLGTALGTANAPFAPPRGTYRMQFHAGFGFAQAAALAPHLAKLGVSHVYASPYLKARPGSTHGYDVVDHGMLNPDLGSEADFRTMVAAFRENGLSQLLDFVPNHVGVGGADNPWWLDVLEWGAASRYAEWFEIDWNYLQGKLLAPFLGDQYGAVLESGQLELRFEAETGSFAVWAYGEYKLPICPLDYPRILDDTLPELEGLSHAFSDLPNRQLRIAARARDLQAEFAHLAEERVDVREAVATAVSRLNGEPGQLDTWRGLDALIQEQHWRLAHYRVAADDINYRRFFNISHLAGLRMELPKVFDEAHRFVFSLLADGTLDGLRIDHIDGLLDPKSYLLRLRERAPRPFYLVIEKILAAHEALREDWPVQGTTGYDFANLVLGVMVNPAGEEGFTRIYEAFTGQRQSFADVVYECKLRTMANELASELNVLARDAGRVARENPRTADFTSNILHRALRELVACFPVYRTYVDAEDRPTKADRRDLDWALAQARRNETDVDISVFDFLGRLLSGDLVAEPRSGFSRDAVLRCAMKLQQYSGAVMAKGLEDTAFYRYNRFVALNEVGGQPDRFGVPLPTFHHANAERARRWPHAMLTTSTHDTKWGEDTRARLAVLSEMPEEWARQVRAWSRILRARRGDVEGTAPPDRNDEYLFYQLLLGAWPADLTGLEDLEKLRSFADRVEGAMVKSVREAKLHSTWTSPNTAYEEAMLGFVRDALDVSRPNAFLSAFLPFQERVARLGVRNSLVQVALKLTLPGMPDIYRGTELWDLSMVDPDNRRPVDYDLRARLLERVEGQLQRDRAGTIAAILEDWRDGAVKLALTATLLAYRREHSALFAKGSYEALAAAGPRADRICAFARTWKGEALLVIAERFPAQRGADPAWDGTGVSWGRAARATCWRNLLTGRVLERRNEALPAETVLAELPVAVLVPKTEA
jgi:(1->4)-alpha-D-glucan 1-alpha-D-glucosylmutase